jgi:hypothetical protein
MIICEEGHAPQPAWAQRTRSATTARPATAPAGGRKSVKMTPAQRKEAGRAASQNIGKLMPWRDREQWASVDREVRGMRGNLNVPKADCRGNWGGPLASTAPRKGAAKQDKQRASYSAELLAGQSTAGRPTSRVRKALAARAGKQPSLRARYDPSRHASRITGLLRIARDPDALGGSRVPPPHQLISMMTGTVSDSTWCGRAESSTSAATPGGTTCSSGRSGSLNSPRARKVRLRWRRASSW